MAYEDFFVLIPALDQSNCQLIADRFCPGKSGIADRLAFSISRPRALQLDFVNQAADLIIRDIYRAEHRCQRPRMSPREGFEARPHGRSRGARHIRNQVHRVRHLWRQNGQSRHHHDLFDRRGRTGAEELRRLPAGVAPVRTITNRLLKIGDSGYRNAGGCSICRVD